MACFAGMKKYIAIVGFLSLSIASYAEDVVVANIVAVSSAQAKAFEYVDKTKGQCLSSLFDGNKFGCPSNSSVVSVPAYVMPDEQCSKNMGVSVPLSQWRETPRPDVRGIDTVLGDLGPVETALDILGKTPSGLEICKSVGASDCSLSQLRKHGVDVVVKSIMPFDIAGECKAEWNWFGGFSGSELALPEKVSNKPVDGAYVLAHEITHSLQMKSFHNIVKDDNIEANRFYMEVDAMLTGVSLAHEFRMNGILKDIAETKQVYFMLDTSWQLWDAKSRFSPVPPSMASLGLEPKWGEDYDKLVKAYASTKRSDLFLLEALRGLVRSFYVTQITTEENGDPKFREYVKSRVKEMDRKWREELSKRKELYDCHKNDKMLDLQKRGNICDLGLETDGVRMANLQMAAEDACSCFSSFFGSGDNCSGVSIQFGIAGESISRAACSSVASQFEPGSCPRLLIEGASSVGAFRKLRNESDLHHFIRNDFTLPVPVVSGGGGAVAPSNNSSDNDNSNNSSDESGNDSSGDDYSNDDGGSESGDDGASNGWDSGHDFNPHFQPGI